MRESSDEMESGSGTGKRPTFDATALILAGGRGVRMGAEKPLVELDGVALVDRVKTLLRPHFSEIVIVTNRPDLYHYEDVKVVCDQVPYQGPLAGIYAGLIAAESDVSFVVASDMPFANLDVIELLQARLAGSDVAVVETETGIEPLFGFYAKSCLEPIGAHLKSGDRKPISFYRDVKANLVSEADVRAIDPDLTSLFNVNTREDLATAKRIMEHAR